MLIEDQSKLVGSPVTMDTMTGFLLSLGAGHEAQGFVVCNTDAERVQVGLLILRGADDLACYARGFLAQTGPTEE